MFIHHLLVSYFHSLAIVNSAVMNIRVLVSSQMIFLSGYMLRRGVAGSNFSPIKFPGKPPCCFPQSLQFNSHRRRSRLPFSLLPLQGLSSVEYLMMAILTGVRWCLVVVLIYISRVICDVSIFLCAYWPCLSLLWGNVYLSLLPIF